ncbi:hypothetical protein [Haloarcula nitratireducens]|uniref:DUF8129 domain-containing protein n=1 Tax=Haloarcula nitratireducens TaxID=2487749 RepID=A0AAW4PKS6_9EURY|nr:hypothetical protein [Halomicroarcula nitratireducens]MBX0298312.1 hypothetical protein [Halomicroarcula nitratireducens]
MSGDSDAAVLEDLPPERLLSGNQLQPTLAGIRCMDSIETIQAYLAYETKHQDRTHVQDKLRLRARELRRGDGDE